MSALERARERWGTAATLDEGSSDVLLDLVASVDLVRRAGSDRGSSMRLHPSHLAPGWWTCPDCGRRADREGERGTARRWCTGERGTVHRATEMRVER